MGKQVKQNSKAKCLRISQGQSDKPKRKQNDPKLQNSNTLVEHPITRAKRSLTTEFEKGQPSAKQCKQQPKLKKASDPPGTKSVDDCFRKVMLKEAPNLVAELDSALADTNNNATVDVCNPVVASAMSLIKALKNKKANQSKGTLNEAISRNEQSQCDKFYDHAPQPHSSAQEDQADQNEQNVADGLGDGVQINVNPQDDDYQDHSDQDAMHL